jgi:hypothetical protein
MQKTKRSVLPKHIACTDISERKKIGIEVAVTQRGVVEFAEGSKRLVVNETTQLDIFVSLC